MTSTRVRRYLAVALERSLTMLAQTGEGGRGHAAYRAACSLGRLVHLGLDEQEVQQALVEAAMAAGLQEREARGHVRRGIRWGQNLPKLLPVAELGDLGTFHTRLAMKKAGNFQEIYPPYDEVSDLWARGIPVNDDQDVAKWLRDKRRLDPNLIDLYRLAVALPSGTLPSWARLGTRTWRQTEHRLLIGLVNAQGELRSIKARAIGEADVPKELAPQSPSSHVRYTVRNLVMADPMARQMLSNNLQKDWRPEVVVTEGGPDFLTWATRWSDARESVPATLGIFSGAWTLDIANRIPDGARVVIRQHPDAGGRQYTTTIIKTLATRCQVSVLREGVPLA